MPDLACSYGEHDFEVWDGHHICRRCGAVYAIRNRVLDDQEYAELVVDGVHPDDNGPCGVPYPNRATSPINFEAESKRTHAHLRAKLDATNREAIVDAIQRALEDHETADCIDHTADGECIFPDQATFIADALAERGFLR